MDHQMFKAMAFLPLAIALNTAAAEEVDSCYSEQGTLAINACFDKKIEALNTEYDKKRNIFINRIVVQTDQKKEFKSRENKVHQAWLLFIRKNCQMRAFSSGEIFGPAYQGVYEECILNQYKDRIKFLTRV